LDCGFWIEECDDRSSAIQNPRSKIQNHPMPTIGGIFALLIGVAGWYYLFYSHAADKLAAIEAPVANQRRRRLRRLNGAAMLLLAVLLYAGLYTEENPRAFMLVWLGVCVLLAIIVVLGIADVWLTAKLRRR
jgi:hypothetical protein